MRNPGCTLCKLHREAEDVCVWGMGARTAKIMVVGKMPNSERYQDALELELTELGFDVSDMYFTQALKCRNFEQSSSNADVKSCRVYLEEELDKVKPKYILALGNEALLALTGRSGITKYRGQVFERADGSIVVATVSPAAVNRNPGQKPGYLADLRLFLRKTSGQEQTIEKPKYLRVDNADKMRLVRDKVLPRTEVISYDVETHSEYWRSDGRVVSVAATCELTGGRLFHFAAPLFHPESPFKSTWRSVMRHLGPPMAKVPKIIAHNGKYDAKWFRPYDADLAPTFDTIIAIHLLNENVQKGLKPQAMARLGVEPWGIDTKNLLGKPLDEILPYNMLDAYYTYLLSKLLKVELIEQPRLARIFKFLMIPANSDLIDSEMTGAWMDIQRLKRRRPGVVEKLQTIHDALGEFLPPPDSAEWPRDARGRPLTPNYNASNFARWFLFQHLGLPVLARGKEKPDGREGDPSMREGLLLELKDVHPAVKLMLGRVEWQKILTSFFDAYAEIYDEDHRVHTNFKLTGTVTGRLSSGKTDAEKISGVRGKLRGVNMQQVPRNPLVRGLFGAPPGWWFVEADYSQIEMRVAAFIAKEDTMLHLFATGADLHTYIVHRITGIPTKDVPKKLRKELGKPVNFGFLYGMGVWKFLQTTFENYGVRFTEDEGAGHRKTYFESYPKLLPWHARQRRLVHENGRVQSPIGRVRHLPDIYSPDKGVRAEAERQAINSPVQSFASDLALFSMIRINREIRRRKLAARCIGLVHDAINFEVREDHMPTLLPLIKDVMENPRPLEKTFGVVLDVPLVADLKLGSHWGDAMELTPEQVRGDASLPDLVRGGPD